MATAETQPAIRNSRVLVASSSESFRRLWIGKAEYETAEMDVAAGGADALAKLESENWGEVLLDRHLHDLDVNEVLQIIRGRHPHLLVRVVDSDIAVEGKRRYRRNQPAPCPRSRRRSSRLSGREESFDDGPETDEEPERGAEKPSRRVEPLPGMMGDGPGLEQIYRLARLVARARPPC